MKKYLLGFSFIVFTATMVYGQTDVDPSLTHTVIRNSIGLGSVIAAITSWERNKSVLWAIIHAIFSWLYVGYFVLTRKRSER